MLGRYFAKFIFKTEEKKMADHLVASGIRVQQHKMNSGHVG
jgi:hypothetical protein